MNPSPRLTVPAVSRLLSIAVLVALTAACSAAQSSSPAASEELPSDEPSVAASAAEASAPGAPELANGELVAGDYTTDIFDETLSLTLDRAYEGQVFGIPGIGLYPVGSGGGLYVFRYDGKLFKDPCDPAAGFDEVDATPEAVMEWLAQHPELLVSQPQAATVGGATGLMVEVTADKMAPCPEEQVATRIYLFGLPEVGDFHFDDGEFDHLYAVTVGDDLLIVASGAIEDGAAFVQLAQPVIDSMEFSPI